MTNYQKIDYSKETISYIIDEIGRTRYWNLPLMIQEVFKKLIIKGDETKQYADENVTVLPAIGVIDTRYILGAEEWYWNGTIFVKLSSSYDNSSNVAALNTKADIASPTFTGTASAPTATVGTNTTQLATTAFVLANGSTPTLQQVLDNNHNLVNGNNFQGDLAGFSSSGTNINALGSEAGVSSSGNNVNALGSAAGAGSSGTNINAFGNTAGTNSSGNGINALGNLAGAGNTGNQVNAFGPTAANGNTGTNVNTFGSESCTNNSGNEVNAFGNTAGASNTFNFVNLFGDAAQADADYQTVFSKSVSAVARLSYINITDKRKYELPDASGTIALMSDLTTKADIASPTFTGTASAPTAIVGTNTTQLATTAFVLQSAPIQLKDFYEDASNSLLTETDLYSYTSVTNRLNTIGEKIISAFAGTFNDTTASSQLKVYFAGNVIGDTGALTMSVTGAWIVSVSIMRTGISTARAIVNISTPGASTASYTKYTNVTGLNFATTNIIKITGTAAGATGGS